MNRKMNFFFFCSFSHFISRSRPSNKTQRQTRRRRKKNDFNVFCFSLLFLSKNRVPISFSVFSLVFRQKNSEIQLNIFFSSDTKKEQHIPQYATPSARLAVLTKHLQIENTHLSVQSLPLFLFYYSLFVIRLSRAPFKFKITFQS